MKLTNENYYSKEANEYYMSSSTFKDFLNCEKQALARVNGEIEEKQSNAMLFGSYIDAYFSGELERFKETTPQLFKKDGTLYKDFENVYEVIHAIEKDELLMKYLSGKHQVVMTGEIEQVPFKIKIDSYIEGVAIVDQKIMSSFKDLVWVEKNGIPYKTDFIDAFGYDIQGAIYREIVRQNTGKTLPFILAVATKEENPDKALIRIDDYYLDKALEFVKKNCAKYDMIKKGILQPKGCGHCPSCRKDKMCESVLSYEQLFHKVREEEYND